MNGLNEMALYLVVIVMILDILDILLQLCHVIIDVWLILCFCTIHFRYVHDGNGRWLFVVLAQNLIVDV